MSHTEITDCKIITNNNTEDEQISLLIACTLAVTSAEAERSFSYLEFIKTRLIMF